MTSNWETTGTPPTSCVCKAPRRRRWPSRATRPTSSPHCCWVRLSEICFALFLWISVGFYGFGDIFSFVIFTLCHIIIVYRCCISCMVHMIFPNWWPGCIWTASTLEVEELVSVPLKISKVDTPVPKIKLGLWSQGYLNHPVLPKEKNTQKYKQTNKKTTHLPPSLSFRLDHRTGSPWASNLARHHFHRCLCLGEAEKPPAARDGLAKPQEQKILTPISQKRKDLTFLQKSCQNIL